ncbi:MAG: alpha/beta hydrolase-fold protein [Myxococcota bacterium]
MANSTSTTTPRDEAEVHPKPSSTPNGTEATPQGALTQPNKRVPKTPPGCAAAGTTPEGYTAKAIAQEGRIDLTGPWRLSDVGSRQVLRPVFDDSGWREVTMPGIWLPDKPMTGKRAVVWLRKRFVLDKAVDRRMLALDLGGRLGRSEIWLNGTRIKKLDPHGEHGAPFVRGAGLPWVEGENVLAIKLIVSRTTGGVRWYGDAALGRLTERRRGRLYHTFTSTVDGTRQRVSVYVPRCADLDRPLPLLIALPGWGGNPHSFAASRLLDEAERHGMVVATPDPRGNRLFTGTSEQGVLETIDLLQRDFNIDPERIGITGTSMGGAGALQLGYHYPDRFAALSSFYGDSLYDLNSYAGPILREQAIADRYSVLRFPANARNLPVLLIHAQDDPVSRVYQSRDLVAASHRLGMTHHVLVDPETGGHTLQLVDDYAAQTVRFHVQARRVRRPERVSFRTNSPHYTGSHWVRVELAQDKRFGAVDLSYTKGTLTVHRLDRGLRTAWVDVQALEMEQQPQVTLQLEEPLGGVLGLEGLEHHRQARVSLVGGDSNRAVVLEGERGTLRLEGLTAGTWQLSWGAQPAGGGPGQ